METEKTETKVSSRRNKKIWKWLLRIAAISCIVVVWWHTFRPNTYRGQLAATCRVETRLWYEITSGGKDTLRMAVSDAHTTDDMGRPLYEDTTHTSGVFVSASGHLVAPSSALLDAEDVLKTDTLRSLLLKEQARLQALLKEQKETVKELEYYARTHSVADDGYNEVMRHGSLTLIWKGHTDSLLTLVDALLSQPQIKARLRHVSTVLTTALPGRKVKDGVRVEQKRVVANCLQRKDGLLLMQTSEKRLPLRSTFVSLYNVGDNAEVAIGYLGHMTVPELISQDVAGRFPHTMTEGMLQLDARGNAVAMMTGRHTVGWDKVRAFCLQEHRLSWLLENAWHGWLHAFVLTKDTVNIGEKTIYQWKENVKVRFQERHLYIVKTDTLGTFAGRYVDNAANGFGLKESNDSTVYIGFFKNGRRQGRGSLTDSLGHTFSGFWQNDTLPQGLLRDNSCVYRGCFNARLQRHGQGESHEFGKSYYNGLWANNLREGFGFSFGERHIVRAGIWKKNAFRGEQMVYTKDRVYGIDISRYQHEIGRKRYGINWSALRITRLGAANASRVRGTQNYPVTFVYVKATEGTTSFNRYYAADIAAARRRGLRVGAYHFFSTKSPGADQARNFIKRAKLQRGDLPPVLDVEPSDQQIAAMGGRNAMYREMMAWLRVVKNHCGTMPILYISQGFVNKYMMNAPASLARYQVWIARYGEYKPYVHLLYWQLSPYGRVAGIQGDVDINVFNGSRKQFMRFAKANAVK